MSTLQRVVFLQSFSLGNLGSCGFNVTSKSEDSLRQRLVIGRLEIANQCP
ncbi:hypothetical protein LguiB_026394 [Lonicera macranthoides]